MSPEDLDRILKRPGYKARDQSKKVGAERSMPAYHYPKSERKGKFNAEPTEVNGIRFPSKKQAGRYENLLMLQTAGIVRELRYEVTYPLAVNGIKVCDYRADFVYFDVDLNREVVEDSKGVRTPVYKLKKLLMLAVHGIKIFES